MREFDLLSETHLGPADIGHTAMPIFRLTLAAIPTVSGGRAASAAKIVNDMAVLECVELIEWIEGLGTSESIPLPGAEYVPFANGDSYWQREVVPLLKRRIKQQEVKPYRGNKFEQAKAAARVEGIAARYTTLMHIGSGKMKGCCPIHNEKSPSLSVDLELQNWHCYGACNNGGDVVALVQKLMMVNKWKRQV